MGHPVDSVTKIQNAQSIYDIPPPPPHNIHTWRLIHEFYGTENRFRKILCITWTLEIQAINLSLISPLMECTSGFIVFKIFNDGTVDNNL